MADGGVIANGHRPNIQLLRALGKPFRLVNFAYPVIDNTWVYSPQSLNKTSTSSKPALQSHLLDFAHGYKNRQNSKMNKTILSRMNKTKLPVSRVEWRFSRRKILLDLDTANHRIMRFGR